jgi:antitoxin CptB
MRTDPIMAPSKPAGDDMPIETEAMANRRRRLRYHAWHRGTKEMDLVLGPYADAHIAALPVAELDRLETLMDEEDTDLLKWVMGQETPRADVDTDLLARLIAFRQETAALR